MNSSSSTTTPIKSTFLTLSDISLDKMDLYKEISEITKTEEINLSNIVNITVNTMQIVEKYKNLNGNHKKNIVLNTIEKLIEHSNLEEKDQENLKTFTRMTLPFVIDTIIVFDKSEIAINIKKRCSQWFCPINFK